jgi:tetratricopeptide (TPR) repeat protein
VKQFPSSPFVQEAVFYLGVGYFHLQDYEVANKHFSNYLKKQTTPRHFEEAIQYKFSIAEQFQGGAKKHVLGMEAMPKWLPAREDAIAIFDEVVSALPHHDLGAKALYGKAELLVKEEDFKAAVETYQTLIRRFPKNSLAVDSYLGIAEVYFTQCRAEYPDLDFLDLAEINLRKFKQDFPGDARVATAEKIVADMKEVYAGTLYETGQFFERTKKAKASLLYYKKVISQYPDTKIAVLAKERMNALKIEEVKKEAPKVIAQAPAPAKEEQAAAPPAPDAAASKEIAETIPRWPIGTGQPPADNPYPSSVSETIPIFPVPDEGTGGVANVEKKNEPGVEPVAPAAENEQR